MHNNLPPHIKPYPNANPNSNRTTSGAGTNLKVGAQVLRKVPEKQFVVSLQFFWLLQVLSTLVTCLDV